MGVTWRENEEIFEPTEKDFFEILPGILEKVGEKGDVEEIDSWREAFPEIEFNDEDAYFRTEVNWDERTTLERAVYVLCASENVSLRLGVSFDFEGTIEEEPGLGALLDGGYPEWMYGEVLWWHWMAGSFRALDLEGNIDEARLTRETKFGLWGDYLSSIPAEFELKRRLEGWFDHLWNNVDIDKMKLLQMKLRVSGQGKS